MQDIKTVYFDELKHAFEPVRGTFVIEQEETDEREQFISLATRWAEDPIGIIEQVVDGWRLVLWFSEALTFRTAAELVEYLLHGPEAALASGQHRILPEASWPSLPGIQP